MAPPAAHPRGGRRGVVQPLLHPPEPRHARRAARTACSNSVFEPCCSLCVCSKSMFDRAQAAACEPAKKPHTACPPLGSYSVIRTHPLNPKSPIRTSAPNRTITYPRRRRRQERCPRGAAPKLAGPHRVGPRAQVPHRADAGGRGADCDCVCRAHWEAVSAVVCPRISVSGHGVGCWG